MAPLDSHVSGPVPPSTIAKAVDPNKKNKVIGMGNNLSRRLRFSNQAYEAGERAWLLPPGFWRHYNHGLPLAGAPALHGKSGCVGQAGDVPFGEEARYGRKAALSRLPPYVWHSADNVGKNPPAYLLYW